ncbi:hypothetical protein SIXOD_v1c07110 [Spiroplasma ixodetis Y32]|nr:hypothetical protein SIXOD_v1c07110 [Spiroplasma ixodetis Y32]
MSKKRCKTKIKIKKDKKENKFKNQIKNIILCDWDKCIKNWKRNNRSTKFRKFIFLQRT